MSLSKADPVNDYTSCFREIEEEVKGLKKLKARAEKTIPEGLGLEASRWDTGGLSRTLSGATIEEFAEAVRLIAKHFGPPDSTDAIGSNMERAPDLHANWESDGERPALRVRCWYPRGCKVDPRTKYEPEKRVAIHPECAAVLKELEDL